MIETLKQRSLVVVGGGNFCRVMLQLLDDALFSDLAVDVRGVADLDAQAEGMRYAASRGIFTTTDFTILLAREHVDVVLEVTRCDTLPAVIRSRLPEGTLLIDHFAAARLWTDLQIEAARRRALAALRGRDLPGADPESVLDDLARELEALTRKRLDYALQIERDLVEHQRTIAEITRGSTIPTFIINKDHVVTHWNKACEALTGYRAEDLIGTRDQWKPFRAKQRPIMADLILDETSEADVLKYYGTKWRKSPLIEGAYEAEEYFAHMGTDGKWLFFTAAPIKAPDGTIIGAIETLWDRTEEKRVEHERERHNRELAAKAKELSASERALAQIIQGSTVPTFVLNQAHVITHWNTALEKLSGYPAASMVGTQLQWEPFWEKERPSMADVILDQLGEAEIHKLYGDKFQRSQLIEGAYEAEEFFPKLGTGGKWCFFTAAPIKAPDGTIVGAIETLWDRTLQRQAEQERERHYTDIAGLCSIYTALSNSLDPDQQILAAIEAMKRFLNFDTAAIFMRSKEGRLELKYDCGRDGRPQSTQAESAEDPVVYRTLAKGSVAIVEPDERPVATLPGDARSLAYIPIKSETREAIGVIRLAAQRPRHFSAKRADLLDLIGNRIGAAIENAMLHRRYIKSEEKYRSLFNNDPNPIFIIDSRRLTILDTNRRAEGLYGYTRNELLGMSFLKLGDPQDEELITGLRGLSTDQSVLFSKKRHYNKAGIPMYVNVNVCYAKYSEDDVLIATTTDVTETVEKEIQLIQAGKMTTLGQMAAGIAHEINQPLNVIQVCADYFLKTLKKGETISADDLRNLATDISDNVHRAAGIIKHMRDFSRQSSAVRTRVNVNHPIRDAFNVLSHQIKTHAIRVQLELDPQIPEIMAEHNRLEQVFINLIANAIDAMDEKCQETEGVEGEKRLLLQSSAEVGQVVVTVSDNGRGMSQGIIDKIFEPFFTTKEIGKGTGLGISISYGIVKEFGGTIQVSSEVGKGTSFKLTFPALE